MNDVANAEMWDVEIANGVIRGMTLDELDAAYQDGAIDENTRVRQSGAPNWSTLAAVAGTEDSYEPPEPVNSLSPMQVSLVSVPPPPAVPREFAHLADLDDDDAELALRRGQKKKKKLAAAGGILGVAAIAGLVAFGATRANATSALQAAAAAAAMAPLPAATSLPAPAEATDKRSLSDDQKKALLDADKKRQAEAEAKRAKNAPKPRTGHPRSNGKDGLLKGGDKFDPLNGAL